MQCILLSQNKPCKLLTKPFNVWEFQGFDIRVSSVGGCREVVLFERF